MTNSIQTSEKTFNTKLKSKIVKLIPAAVSFNKKHVAGIGYVFYIKNANNAIVGKTFKETLKGMKIIIN